MFALKNIYSIKIAFSHQTIVLWVTDISKNLPTDDINAISCIKHKNLTQRNEERVALWSKRLYF